MAIFPDTFFLDPDYKGTLQRQIQSIVAEAILSGRFRAGEKMPSSRKLAEHLGISRITVTLAYTELVADDYLTARGRSGYFVSDNAPRRPEYDLPARKMRETVDWGRITGHRYSGVPGLRKPANWRDYRYSFIYGQADPKLFDHHNWRLCALQALGQKDFDALTSDNYERDDPRLLEFIARHTLPRRGIVAEPEEILVTMGAQNALWIAAQVLLTQRRTAVIENPCYPGLRGILSQTRCAVTPVDVDGEGLPPDAVPEGTDVVFVTPSHQCPTSVTLPVERRQRLLALAAERDFLVVEDDYEFEMSFPHAPAPALKSLDREGRVIYVGSFSKSIFPGLRLGYLVGSEAFIREARALRATVLRHPPGHLQRTAAYFLSLGHFDAQIRRMGQAYRARRASIDDAVSTHGLTRAGVLSHGGSALWMRAPDGIDTAELAGRLLKDGVLIEPGRDFFSGPDAPRGFYRLAYSSIAAGDIAEGVRRIARAIADSRDRWT